MTDFNLVTLPLMLAILYTVSYTVIKRDFLLITAIILIALKQLTI